MRKVKVKGVSKKQQEETKRVDHEIEEYHTLSAVLDTVVEYMRTVTTEIQKLQARCDSLESHVDTLVKASRSPNK